MSQVSRIIYVIVFVIAFVFVFVFVIVFFCQVISPYHSDQMSYRSKLSKVALWRCSSYVFVFVIVFVFVFVFFLVRSCLLIALITCLKGHKSLRVLYGSVFEQCVVVTESVCQWVSDNVTYRAVWRQLKTKRLKHWQFPYPPPCSHLQCQSPGPFIRLKNMGVIKLTGRTSWNTIVQCSSAYPPTPKIWFTTTQQVTK